VIVLPAILDKARVHTASYVTKGDRFVPNEKEAEFWDAIYNMLAQSGFFIPPIRTNFDKKVNPYFGRFGARWNVAEFKKKSFHNGIDVEGRRKTKLHAMADGVLEHAGYGVINGKYIMLSHPQVTTEDGFVLHSLYMHLSDYSISFTSYQKMLRQISLNTYPVVHVEKDATLGSIGKTGVSSYPDQFTHAHIQIDFKDPEGRIIHIDPLRVLGVGHLKNLTADLGTEKQFFDVYLKNRKDIFKRKLQEVWQKFKDKI
jgi:murein DD-endopeptidase MepM/ murein hydrolase activator NlpD